MGRKKRHTGFQKGHQYYPSLTSAETGPQANQGSQEAEENQLSESSESVPSPSPSSVPSVTTRAAEVKRNQQTLELKKQKSEHSRANVYFIANVASLESLFEKGLNAKHETNCLNRTLKLQKNEQRMISTSWSLECAGCTFKSEPVPMYKTVEAPHKFGPKESTLNKAFCGALLASSIQGTQIAKIFLECGILPGGIASINRKCASSSVADSVVQQGHECLDETRKAAESRRNIHVIQDTMYQNPIRYDDSTPKSRTTQKVATCLDRDTGDVLDVDVQTMLCAVGGRALRSRKVPTCGDPNDTSHKCRGNITRNTNIGDEASSIKKHAEKLKNLDVKEVTTDGDSTVDGAIKEDFPKGTVHTLDFHHSSKNLTKALTKVNIRPDAFPAPTSREDEDAVKIVVCRVRWQRRWQGGFKRRNYKIITKVVASRKPKDKPKLKETLKQRGDRLKKSLCIDIRKRINMEICAYHYVLSKKNTERVKPEELAKKLEGVVDVAIRCVAGMNCGENCSETSLVCIGGVHRKKHKLLLSDQGVTGITHLDEEEIKNLTNIIVQRKTGLAALTKSPPRASTQKNEAFNKSLSTVIPKSVTYIATIHARVLRAVMGRNLGKAEATFAVLARAQHEISDEARAQLIKIEMLDMRRKKLHASAEYKRRRNQARKQNFDMHEAKKSSEVRPPRSKYKKGIEFDSASNKKAKRKKTT